MENTITLFVYKILKFPPIMPPGAQPAPSRTKNLPPAIHQVGVDVKCRLAACGPGRSGRKVTKSLTPAFIFSAFVLPYKEDSGIEINAK
jgi:hypothetical protein